MEPLPPPTFDPAKSYLVAGKLLNDILKAIRVRTPRAGRNTTTTDSPDGILIHAGPGGGDGTTTLGAFFAMTTVESEDADNGDIYLQGGNVGGGTGNEEVDEVLLYDASAETWAGSPGQHLQLDITGNGQETSGILDPVFNVTAASVSVVASIGANTLPASGSVTGKHCKISLGTFYDGGFNPSATGDVNVTFCWGGYSPNRVA